MLLVNRYACYLNVLELGNCMTGDSDNNFDGGWNVPPM
jgi:hypothetical protein